MTISGTMNRPIGTMKAYPEKKTSSGYRPSPLHAHKLRSVIMLDQLKAQSSMITSLIVVVVVIIIIIYRIFMGQKMEKLSHIMPGIEKNECV